MSKLPPRRSATALALAGAAALGVAIASPAMGASAAKGGVVVDGQEQCPASLNVMLSEGTSAFGSQVVSTIQQNMLGANAKGKYFPELAVRIPSVENGLVKTNPLRVTWEIEPAARWSDGKNVTAQDAIFTWQTMINPKNAVADTTGWTDIKSIRAQGPKTFVVTFKRNYAAYKEMFSRSAGFFMLPKHVLQGKDFNTVWATGGVIGSGPFLLESFQPDVRAVVKRNPNYWDKKKSGGGPYLNQIVFNCIGDIPAEVAAFKSGEADSITPAPNFDLIPDLRTVANSVVQARPSNFFEHIAFNTSKAPFDDVKLRQAFAYAIDRTELTQKLLYGQVKPLNSSLVPFTLGYKPSFAKYTRNTARAKQLIESAGWTLGSDGIYTKGGNKLEFDLKTTAGNTQRLRNLQLLGSQLQAAGMKANIVTEPGPSKLFATTLPQGDYQVALYAFGGGVDPDQSAIFAIAQIPEAPTFGGQNYYRWANPKANALLTQQLLTLDPAKRVKLLGQWQDMQAEDVPFIPLYQRPQTLAFRNKITGPDENPIGNMEAFWNSSRWRLTGKA